MTINDVKDVPIMSFKTSCCYTGEILNDSIDKKLIPLKLKLIQKAIEQYKTVTACTPFCFQVYEQKLLFWFNSNETTKTISETIEDSLVTYLL